MTETASTRSFEDWLEIHERELWIKFHEAGANYDTDYEKYLESQYELSLRRLAPAPGRGSA